MANEAMSDKCKIAAIQAILGCDVDGLWGPETQAAVDELLDGAHRSDRPTSAHAHRTYASSFADPADVAAFKDCKAKGNSDEYCFQFGDNGIGCWGDSTVEGTGPSCALPPEYMEKRWGTVAAAKHKAVKVVRERYEVVCILKDRMPHVENLANEAHIDLNPDACAEIGLEPPIMAKVTWWWVVDLET